MKGLACGLIQVGDPPGPHRHVRATTRAAGSGKQLYAPVGLAEVHVAEALVGEDIGFCRDPGGGVLPGRCGPRRAGRRRGAGGRGREGWGRTLVGVDEWPLL